MRWLGSLVGVLLLASVAQARTVELAWDPPDSGDPPQGYTMYKKGPGQPMFELVASMAAGVLTWADEQVGTGESCWYVTAWSQSTTPPNRYAVWAELVAEEAYRAGGSTHARTSRRSRETRTAARLSVSDWRPRAG